MNFFILSNLIIWEKLLDSSESFSCVSLTLCVCVLRVQGLCLLKIKKQLEKLLLDSTAISPPHILNDF